MSTGDVKNNIRKLQYELRKVKYPFDIDSDGLLSASWDTLQPIYKYIFSQYSPVITEEVQLRLGFDLSSRVHSRFLEGLYRVLRDIYQYKPPITKEQLCANGFVERKIMMCTEVVKMVQNHLSDITSRQAKSAILSYGSSDKVLPSYRKCGPFENDSEPVVAKQFVRSNSFRKQEPHLLHASKLNSGVTVERPKYDAINVSGSPAHEDAKLTFSPIFEHSQEMDAADVSSKLSGPRTSSPGFNQILPPVKFDVEVPQPSSESLTDDDSNRTTTAEICQGGQKFATFTDDKIPIFFLEFKKGVEKSLNMMLSKITLLETRVSGLEHRLEVIQAKENSPIQRVKPLAISQSPDIISKQANQILKVANHD